MSDLKYQTIKELNNSKASCIEYISDLKSKISGQEQRLIWINKYIFEKTPVEMSISEIEKTLGHKIILKEGL